MNSFAFRRDMTLGFLATNSKSAGTQKEFGLQKLSGSCERIDKEVHQKNDARVMHQIQCVFLGIMATFFLPTIVNAQTMPGGRPEDVQMALHNPHEYAWQLFMAANTEADETSPGSTVAGASITKYNPDKATVWETWALASGGRAGSRRSVPNRSEVFLDRGTKPEEWGKWTRNKTNGGLEWFSSKRLEFANSSNDETRKSSAIVQAFHFDEKKRFQVMSDPTLPGRAEPIFEGGRPTADEVRMNKITYNHIRDNRLYSIEGLEATLVSNKAIKFPNEAQEVKAQWVLFTDDELKKDPSLKERYHWRTIAGPDGKSQIWGLSGWHIITRDLPNWFWCDFEHVDYLPYAELGSDDPTTRGKNAAFKGLSEGERKETTGSKWANYRLRGIQIDFADSRGFPTILANSQIEKSFQQTSSCITCHARATVGLRSTDSTAPPDRTFSLSVFEEANPVLIGSIGYPNRKWFVDERGRSKYAQTDFLWSMPFRACSESEASPGK